MTSVLPTLIPSLAVIMSNIQLASPLRVVLICRKHNTLGSLNPVPWAVALLNCMAYMLYGCLAGDPFVMASVTLGLPINYFALSSALGILGKSGKVSDNITSWKLDSILLIGLGVWIVIAFTLGAMLPQFVAGNQLPSIATSVVGFVACATCMLFYFSPLSVLREIIKNKDAAGLYMPMVVMNLITSTMWSAYGFIFIGDVVVYAPNMFAMLLSATQLSLKCIYPSIDPSKLQRKLTVVEMEEDYAGGDESKVSFMESPRRRAGTYVQDIVCGDGTVGVIVFNEEELANRNRRSNTITSVTERVLDTIDFIGPRRHPADVQSNTEEDEEYRPARESQSPRRGRSVSFSAGTLAMSPTRNKVSTDDSASHPLGTPKSTHSSARGRGRDRRRSQSFTEIMPQIDEEANLSVPTMDESMTSESYTYGGSDALRASEGKAAAQQRSDPHAPLLPSGEATSSGGTTGAHLLSSLVDAVQGVRSRSASRASASAYDPLEREAHGELPAGTESP